MSSAEHEIRAVADLSARRARDQAWRQFSQARSAEEFCSSWLGIQCQLIGGVSDGVVVLQKPGGSGFVPVAFHPENPSDRGKLAEVTERALKERQGVVLRLGAAAANDEAVRCQLASPVQLDGELRGVVGLELEPRPEPQVRLAMRELQWGSGWLEVLLRRHAAPQDVARLRLKLALDLVSALLEHEGLTDSGAAFVTELATRTGCDRVTLGVLERGRVRVRAVSHSGQFDKRANLLQFAAEAMEEAIDQKAAVSFPPAQDGARLVARAHELLQREAGAGSDLPAGKRRQGGRRADPRAAGGIPARRAHARAGRSRRRGVRPDRRVEAHRGTQPRDPCAGTRNFILEKAGRPASRPLQAGCRRYRAAGSVLRLGRRHLPGFRRRRDRG
jgi:hypothetical protein